MVGKQKGRKRLQETMDANMLTDWSFDTDNCYSAQCLHRYLLPIGIYTGDINIHNNIEKIIEWL